VDYLFETFEATLEAFANRLNLSVQAVRYNLKPLIDLGIIARISEKIRDKNAIYRFADQ
jgi:predicted transcriptional regulator